MPVFLIITALILGASAVNGSVPQLGQQVTSDLFGSNGKTGFLVWAMALLIVTGFFKIIDLPDAGKALGALIILGFILNKNESNLLSQLTAQFESLSNAGPASGQSPSQSSSQSPPAGAAPSTPGAQNQ